MAFSGVATWGLWGGFTVIVAGMFGAAFLDGRQRQRKIYWVGWLAGGLIMTVAVAAQHPDRSLGIAGFCAAMSVLIAFFRTPFLKIGGKIYAASAGDRQPDPPEDG
ncbi:hypothetical protein BTO20_06910 [Mycobacterium dioxanotrophicus]|jgi:hypothetical protein|uniref:Uncharacterized protein n=1 Tax=Mycobacterium dioxanotrophicus TaxID=482462 RepID=A0A1Y0BZN7_9MYCO|nr:hypothetical protein [Mycobacterium dioxanotrophicus]ART68344.1 hypothetical protein BTO20_06910 [Mycobacterium dioxanotrophicus]